MAEYWIDFQVPVEKLTLPPESPLGNPDTQLLSAVRLAVLRYARSVISGEIQHSGDLVTHSRE
jgi:hypothetical protein